jgi:tetratricopeptide (TPR) repeat protein
MIRSTLLAVLLVALTSTEARAQLQPLKMPDPSPAASLTQTVGLTELSVAYHRPAVGGRPIWNALVPYGEVWRAGANENTTVSFSSAVKVGGKPLAAGTYGLHMIPTAKEWTVIFSNMSKAWGSFTYDPKEDALRVTVTPQPAEAFEERLSYRFDNPTESGVTLALRWEKLKVPVAIEVDTPAVVMANHKVELRGLAGFGWLGPNQAARYLVTHGGDLDEAEKLTVRSLGATETYGNLTTMGLIKQKRGDAKAAAEFFAKANEKASEAERNQAAYELLQAKKVDEAVALFQKNVQAHPTSWNVYDSLAEAQLAKGDKKGAAENYGKALSLVKDDANHKRIEQVLTRLK